jgi:EpsI family protein
MKLQWIAWTLAATMCGASIAGVAARPNKPAGTDLNLEVDVPVAFGEWTQLKETAQILNPATEKLLGEIYAQILSRAYVDKSGYRIMLSVAYGSDQRGGLQAHKPEVCYPAQGFKVSTLEDGVLPTSFGDIAVRRLTTSMGPRYEPVTYWLTVGDRVVRTRLEKRVAEVAMAITGRIPDGVLFRVSSIDRDSAQAFAMQQKFAADLMGHLSPRKRRHLGGLVPAAAI